MVNSMTGFAARTGQSGEYSWSWDLRSLNSKGLDLRMRVPDWIDGLEVGLRGQITGVLKRGSLSLGLKLSREAPEGAVEIDPAGLDRVLGALAHVTLAAEARGVALAQARASDILSMKGVQRAEGLASDTTVLRDTLLADFAPLLKDFLEMRAREGTALQAILSEQLDEVARLRDGAVECLAARAAKSAAALKAALTRVLDAAETVDDARVAQELAMIAVKADITEELDRLAAHVVAARALLQEDGPIGRKLDFLTQEFNREANTLCSKSQDVALTRIGLDLKTVIDQMREQVQNVE